MDIECYLCGEQLEEMGFLLFTPPVGDSAYSGITHSTTVTKIHLCAPCGYPERDSLLRRHQEMKIRKLKEK